MAMGDEWSHMSGIAADINAGGVCGYANARGLAGDYPSTLEFEERVLRDVAVRSYDAGVSHMQVDNAALSLYAVDVRAMLVDAFGMARDALALCDPAEVPASLAASMNDLYRRAEVHGVDLDRGPGAAGGGSLPGKRDKTRTSET